MRTLFVLFLLNLILNLTLPLFAPFAAAAQAPEKEIPVIVEDDVAKDASGAAESGRKVTVVSDASKVAETKPKKAKPKTETLPAATGEAKAIRTAGSIEKLVKTFVKYRPDAVIAPAFYDESDPAFDAARAESLKGEITAWKKMRIEAKGLKGKDDAKFEKKYKEIKDLEEKICADYGKSGEKPVEIAVEPAATPKTDDEEDRAAAKKVAEERLEKVRKEREGGKYVPAKLRWRPSRLCFNKVDAGQEARGSFMIRNVGRSPFEGAVVSIEDWITVTPPTVLIEPNAEIEIDVKVTAPDRKNSRYEGSVELRAVGESSRRVPIVLRTARK